MNTSQLLSFTVSSNKHQNSKLERLDKFLSTKYPMYSRHFFQNLIINKKIFVNGKSVKKSYPFLNENDCIEIHLDELKTQPSTFLPQKIPLNIIYEDDHIIVINKPRGLVVHPAAGHYEGTLINALLYYFKDLLVAFPNDKERPGIIHRLDKDTSGLLIVAKNIQAKNAFSKLFLLRQIQKEYLAICINSPKVTCIKTNISRNSFNRKEMIVSDKGKLAITNCNIVSSKNNLSLVQLYPLTGRTHQLRVHLKYIGCPILGDPIYGSSKKNAQYGLSQQLLHAFSLEFLHPFTKEKLHLKSTLPEDMEKIIKTYIKIENL